jgi:F-box domain
METESSPSPNEPSFRASDSVFPFEIFREIFQYLDLRTLAAVRAVSRICYIIADELAGPILRNVILTKPERWFLQAHSNQYHFSESTNINVIKKVEKNCAWAKTKVFGIYGGDLGHETGTFKFTGPSRRCSAWNNEGYYESSEENWMNYTCDEMEYDLAYCFLQAQFEFALDDTQTGVIIYGICPNGVDKPLDIRTKRQNEFGCDIKTHRMYLKTVGPMAKCAHPLPMKWVNSAFIRREIVVKSKIYNVYNMQRWGDYFTAIYAQFINDAKGGMNFHPFLAVDEEDACKVIPFPADSADEEQDEAEEGDEEEDDEDDYEDDYEEEDDEDDYEEDYEEEDE